MDDKKIKSATEGMQQECYDRLLKLDNFENDDVIADYLIASKNETNTKVSTRTTICLNIRFAQKIGKPLGNVTKDDLYFNGLKKLEDIDPKHKWKGYWNMLRIIIPRFFKWYYSPNLPPSKRPKKTRYHTISSEDEAYGKTYKPIDMWTIEENELFLKYSLYCCCNRSTST